METHLYRTDDPKGSRYEMAGKWFGKSFLKLYDATHRLDVDFSRLESSLVYEPLLHHGHGFDFFIVE